MILQVNYRLTVNASRCERERGCFEKIKEVQAGWILFIFVQLRWFGGVVF